MDRETVLQNIMVNYRKYGITEDIVNEVIDALENSNEEHQHEEIGDVLEVLDAIMHFKKFDHEEVLRKKEEKKLKKGGFYKKVILYED